MLVDSDCYVEMMSTECDEAVLQIILQIGLAIKALPSRETILRVLNPVEPIVELEP